ncbi:MAG: MBL fold hydrolase, partial [Candidatus Magasanikbacteria bacterium CG10_big_fil_rev_8_21_14_0_10_43_6]
RAFPVYKKYPEYYDTAACEKYMRGNDFLDFERLTLTATKEESMKINHVPNPKLIIAGAGMMNGGRILHHAKRYLSDPNATLIIVGYQAQGTLGRKLYEGAETVLIHEEKIPVHAKILAIGALSAHGDQTKLISWIRNAETMPKKVYCVHGEAHAATKFAHKLRDDLGVKTFVPEEGETVEV